MPTGVSAQPICLGRGPRLSCGMKVRLTLKLAAYISVGTKAAGPVPQSAYRQTDSMNAVSSGTRVRAVASTASTGLSAIPVYC